MVKSRTFEQPRYNGTCYTIEFSERPKCTHCEKPMKVVSHSKPVMRIGLGENYEISITYYRCGHPFCPGARGPLTRPPNPYCADHDEYDYEVKAKVCELRWSRRLTYEEIEEEMDRLYGIKINHSAIEIVLKMYELGCAEKYRPEYIEKIHSRGGVLLQVDAMKPLKGRAALYVARDYYTGLTLSSKHLHREGQREIEDFLRKLHVSLKGLGIPVLGVISDAHTGQLKAIEAVFGPEIPHSLCHFHFFQLILIKPKALDSQVLTRLRTFLRHVSYIQEYRERFKGNHIVSDKTPFLEHVLHDLYILSNWRPRKQDPTFSAIAYYQRIEGIAQILARCIVDLDKQGLSLDPLTERRMRKLVAELEPLLDSLKSEVEMLMRIQEYLHELAGILEANEEPGGEGLKRLQAFIDSIDSKKSGDDAAGAEQEFLNQLVKFVKTKGLKLFAYRQVPDAPRTNNSQEISFKQIKHLLRRTIGYSAAGAYLLAHGERMLFVNPEEPFPNIVKMLSSMNWSEGRKSLKTERVPRNAITFIIHDPNRWAKELARLEKKWALLIGQI